MRPEPEPNSTAAIGTPEASDFFEPHIRIAIRSGSAKRNRLPARQLAAMTIASNRIDMTIAIANWVNGSLSHKRSMVAAEKAL